ncbi:MAG: hypothetical protein JXA93_24135 [Anaerolineae bacterium]|nr:hypothetical protein [Anaerolineae bacterium]
MNLEECKLANAMMETYRVQAELHGETYLPLYPVSSGGRGWVTGSACWLVSNVGKALVAAGRQLESLGVPPVLPTRNRAIRTG